MGKDTDLILLPANYISFDDLKIEENSVKARQYVMSRTSEQFGVPPAVSLPRCRRVGTE